MSNIRHWARIRIATKYNKTKMSYIHIRKLHFSLGSLSLYVCMCGDFIFEFLISISGFRFNIKVMHVTKDFGQTISQEVGHIGIGK